MIAYVDSSALVTLVVAETETGDLAATLDGYDAVATSELAVFEVTRAAARDERLLAAAASRDCPSAPRAITAPSGEAGRPAVTRGCKPGSPR